MVGQPNATTLTGAGNQSRLDFLGRLSDLVNLDDFDNAPKNVVDAAPNLVLGCDHASLIVSRGTALVTAWSGDPVAEAVDTCERELGEGPCVDAVADGSIHHHEVTEGFLVDASRWPGLTARLLTETPVRVLAGVHVRNGEGRSGSLNLSSDTAGGLTNVSLAQGVGLASVLSVAMQVSYQRRVSETLRDGLDSNREIGKAVGLMMAFRKLSDDVEAFTMLRRTSQDLNLKLVDVARQVVEHHNRV